MTETIFVTTCDKCQNYYIEGAIWFRVYWLSMRQFHIEVAYNKERFDYEPSYAIAGTLKDFCSMACLTHYLKVGKEMKTALSQLSLAKEQKKRENNE